MSRTFPALCLAFGLVAALGGGVLGAGVPKNLDSAREWWTRAAKGQYRARAMLATVYGQRSLTTGSFLRTFTVDCRQGCGVPRDPQLAYECLRLAQNLVPSNSEAARQQLTQRRSFTVKLSRDSTTWPSTERTRKLTV
jgi:TPR repeat protein